MKIPLGSGRFSFESIRLIFSKHRSKRQFFIRFTLDKFSLPFREGIVSGRTSATEGLPKPQIKRSRWTRKWADTSVKHRNSLFFIWISSYLQIIARSRTKILAHIHRRCAFEPSGSWRERLSKLKIDQSSNIKQYIQNEDPRIRLATSTLFLVGLCESRQPGLQGLMFCKFGELFVFGVCVYWASVARRWLCDAIRHPCRVMSTRGQCHTMRFARCMSSMAFTLYGCGVCAA